MGRPLVALVALAALVFAAPAAAVDTQVNLGTNNGNDRTISPVDVTIDPGDTVTWRWGSPGDTDHTTTSPIDGRAPGAR